MFELSNGAHANGCICPNRNFCILVFRIEARGGGTGPNYRLCPTTWLRLLLEKLIVSHLVKNFPRYWARGGTIWNLNSDEGNM